MEKQNNLTKINDSSTSYFIPLTYKEIKYEVQGHG